MVNIWSMSEGRFLVLYAVILVTGAGLCLLTRALALRAPARLRRSGPVADGALHPVDLACIGRGPDHAAVVAFLCLWQRGVLRPRDGSLPVPAVALPLTRAELAELTVPWEVVDGMSGADHPVEEEVVKAVREAGEAGEHSAKPPQVRQEEAVSELLSRLRRRLDPRAQVQQRLMALGLIVDRTTERRVYLAVVWPMLVLGIGVTWLIAHAGDNTVVLGALLLAAAGLLLAALRSPRVTPLGRRVVAVAGRPTLEVAKRMAQQMKHDRPYGTDDPEIERIGTDPTAAAAHGPALVWGAAPVLPASFGFLPPRPGTRSHGGMTSTAPDSWIAGMTGGSLAGWGTLTGWSGAGDGRGDGGDWGADGSGDSP